MKFALVPGGFVEGGEGGIWFSRTVEENSFFLTQITLGSLCFGGVAEAVLNDCRGGAPGPGGADGGVGVETAGAAAIGFGGGAVGATGNSFPLKGRITASDAASNAAVAAASG